MYLLRDLGVFLIILYIFGGISNLDEWSTKAKATNCEVCIIYFILTNCSLFYVENSIYHNWIYFILDMILLTFFVYFLLTFLLTFLFTFFCLLFVYFLFTFFVYLHIPSTEYDSDEEVPKVLKRKGTGIFHPKPVEEWIALEH